MTPPELRLWSALRARPAGFKFRRQHPVGPYVLDFYCREAALAVEVDGIVHDMGSNPAGDARRDKWLAERGIMTLRILAADVLDLDAVVRLITAECRSRAPSRQ